MSNPIYTLARLLTTIQRFTDAQTDQLQELLGFGYNPDDAYEALNQLQALRDLPEDAIERVRKYLEAVADFPAYFAKGGVIASIPVYNKAPIELTVNDVQRLLRAAGVFKIGAGKVRIGHPTTGVNHETAGHMLREQAREAGVPDELIDGAAEMGRDMRTTTPAEIEKEWTFEKGWVTYGDGSHGHGDLPTPVRADYVAEASLAEELAAEGIPLTEGAEDLLKDWELLETADAWTWAREFVKRYAPNWTSLRMQESDAENLEALMLSWFASALETGKHFGAEKARERLIAAEEEKALRLLDAAREQAREDEAAAREQEEAEALVRAAVEREEKNAKERKAAELEEAERIARLRPHQRAGEHRTLKQARRERFEAGQKLKAERERRNRRDALVATFRDGRKPKEALVEAVTAVMELQDYLTEMKRVEPLVGYKIVPKNAVVFDVDDVNKRVAAAMEDIMKTLRKTGLS
jgi:hypothetical protein